MLPIRRGREGGGTEIGSPEDFGGDIGYASPAPGSGPSEREPSGPGSGSRGRPTSIAEQLDDDIPFPDYPSDAFRSYPLPDCVAARLAAEHGIDLVYRRD